MENNAPSQPVKVLATQFIQDLNTRDLPRLMLWFHDDAQLWIPPAPIVQGAKRIQLLLRLIFRRYSNIQWEITELYQSSENIILVEMHSFGTFTDGKVYDNQLISLIKYNSNGQIFYISDYFKNTAVFL